MKVRLIVLFLALTHLLNAQSGNTDVNKFVALFKQEMSKLTVGKIEEHFDQGYFKSLSESEYFDKDVDVGITSIYQTCAGKDEAAARQEIANFFTQHKRLKSQRGEIAGKMTDFNYIKSYLKIRIYSDQFKAQYENHGIVVSSNKGIIEVVVLDLPSGIGSLEKKYLDSWHKSAHEIYLVAKENTLNSLNHQFEEAEAGKNGEEFYLLSSDNDLFLTSLVLDLKKANPPVGKYGTLISVPNNIVIIALPLNDKKKIDQFCLSLMGLTDYMYSSEEIKPVSNNLFWLNGNDVLVIDKDVKKKKFIYPAPMQELVGK